MRVLIHLLIAMPIAFAGGYIIADNLSNIYGIGLGFVWGWFVVPKIMEYIYPLREP